jgi:hypothetical protein
MAARAAIALSLAVLMWTSSARAEDDPACAQYREPMAYNLCLAQHGPKANSIGKLRGGPQLGQSGQGRVYYGQTRRDGSTAHVYSPQDAHRVHGRMHMEFRVR